MPRKLTEQLVGSKEAADVARYSAYVRGRLIFQQDSAPAHRARDNIELLWYETPDFIGPDVWPVNSPDLNPVDYRIWGWYKNASIRQRFGTQIIWCSALPVSGLSWSKASLIKPLNSGGQRWELAFVQSGNTLNSY